MRPLLLLLLVLAQPEPPSARPVLVSHTSTGGVGQGASGVRGLATTRDGRFAVFASEAADLVPGDANRRMDVFLHDRRGGRLRRVSVDDRGRAGNAPSLEPDVDDAGTRVVFTSFAASFDADDDTPWSDVYLKDLTDDSVRRLSVPLAGGGTDGNSSRPSLSGNGRFVVFESFASGLVRDDDNDAMDVFLVDLRTGERRCLSRTPDGSTGRGHSSTPVISGNGAVVAFVSEADDLVPGDHNGAADVFLADLAAGTLTRVTGADAGGSAGCGLRPGLSLSHSGRYLAFVSCAADLLPGVGDGLTEHVYLHDAEEGDLDLVSVTADGRPVDGRCFSPSVSDDGRLVAFHTAAPSLTGGKGLDAVFLRDRARATTRPVPLLPPTDDAGFAPEALGAAGPAVLSGDGRVVLFASDVPDLAPGDDNGATDVFLVDL